MVAKNLPDWLPAGWTLQFKVKNGRKVRYYTNLKTGQKFFSKNDVIRYNKFQPTNSHIKRRSGHNHTQLVLRASELPAWLPKGWTIELKVRKSGSAVGTKYKCFVDPLTGCRFYSQPEVLQYLKTVKRSSCAPKQKKTGIGMQSASKVEFEKHTAEDLPPGWIKEVKIRKHQYGIKRDPYYTDPVSGYVFRSRKDVLRYLETGEIGRHAFKPKKRPISNVDSINNEISPSSAAKRQKLKHPATRRQLFAGQRGKRSSDMSSITLPEVEGSEKWRGKRVSAKNEPVSTPAADILQEKDSLESSMEKRSNRKTHINLRKTKKKRKKELNLPSRSSKRLAGLEPELVANVMSSERALWVAARKSCKIEECTETKENSNLSRSELPKAVGSKRSRGKRVSAENDPVSIPAADILQEKDSLEIGTEKSSNRKSKVNLSTTKKKKELNLPSRSSKRLAGLEPELKGNMISSEHALLLAARKSYRSEKCAETKEKSHPNRSALPKTEGSKRNRGGKVSTKHEPVSLPAVDIMQDKDLLEREMKKSNNRKAQINLSKSKKKKELNLPFRSSKRLSGLEPELGANSMSSGLALPVAGKRCKSEASPDVGSAPGSLAGGASQQVEAEPEAVLAHYASTDINPCFDEVPSNMSKKPIEDQAVHEEQLQKLETEKKNGEKTEPKLIFPFGDSCLDPCLEFAFKTLTGAIPIEDNLAIQGCFRQQLGTSHTSRDGSLALPDFSFPSCFQSDILSQFDTPEKPVSRPQLPVNPSLPPPGNVSLPSCSGIGSQQPCLENNKKFH